MIRPSDNRDGWNKIILAGLPSPGVVTISGATRAIGWDVKDADGQKGASATRKKEPLGKFDASFYLVDDPSDTVYGDFEQWDAFEALLWVSVSEAAPIALEVVHPELNRLRYTAVVLREMGEMALDGKGGGTIKVGFLEYRPPAPKPPAGVGGTKTVTPGGSSDHYLFDDLTPEEQAQAAIDLAKGIADLTG